MRIGDEVLGLTLGGNYAAVWEEAMKPLISPGNLVFCDVDSRQGITKGENTMARFRRKSYDPPTIEAMRIKAPEWVCPTNRGCWLVEDEYGRQQVLSDAMFKDRFERV